MDRLKGIIGILIVLFPCILCKAEVKTMYAALPTDSIDVCRFLEEARHMPRTTNFPLFFARKFLGKPY